MPADYISTARALSISPGPASPSIRPPWTTSPRPTSTGGSPLGPTSSSSSHGRRRLGSRASLPRQPLPMRRRMVLAARYTAQTLVKAFLLLGFWQRVLAAAVLVGSTTAGILFLVYSHAVFSWLGPVARGWRSLGFAGWVISWMLVFCTAFPPMIGYSTATTVAGFVYGFPAGWPIAASASTVGSLVAFWTARTVASGYVHRLVGKDARFVALGQVLRREGLGVLTGIRFCPLPFSLSNGFLATIPSIRPWAFAVSTALASPKLLVHIFIGSRLALLAENGDKMTARDKAINYMSMIVGGAVGLGVGWLIYRRTMARAAEIALETAAEEGGVFVAPREGGGGGGGGGANGGGAYEDDDGYNDAAGGVGDTRPLMDPDDAAAIMADDDISLWEADQGYRDEEEGGGSGGSPAAGLGIGSDGEQRRPSK